MSKLRKTQIDQIFDAVEANRSKVTAALFVEHASRTSRRQIHTSFCART